MRSEVRLVKSVGRRIPVRAKDGGTFSGLDCSGFTEHGQNGGPDIIGHQ